MKFLVDNWSLLIIIAIVAVITARYLQKLYDMPSEEQQRKVKEWLLYAVIMAEKEYQSGTGALKLRAVYNDFVAKFPSLVAIISFDLFALYVDEALVEMKRILSSNKDIEAYVEGLNK